MKSNIILLLGVLLFAAGTFFALQGADVVHWPRESVMVGKSDWTEYGIVIAIIGVMLIFTARRIRR